MRQSFIFLINFLLFLLVSLNYYSLLPGANMGKTPEQLLEELNRKNELTKLNNSLGFWNKQLETHEGNRDIYLKISGLSWQLEDYKTAKESLNVAKTLDPNYELGKLLEEKISFIP